MTATAWPLEFELPLDGRTVGRWLYARDLRMAAPPAEGTAVPLSFLVFLRAQPVVGVDFHQLLDRDPDRGLYGGVSYRALAPLRVGQVLRASGEVTAREQAESPRGALALTTFTTTYRIGGDVVATEAVRMIDLPPGPPGAPAPQAAQAPRHPCVAEIPALGRAQVAWLTVETGDVNALHLDAAYAASRGFPDVVVPATLLNALIERELARIAGGALREFSARYHAPTYPGEPLQVHATTGEGSLAFELFAGGSLRASGRARWGDES